MITAELLFYQLQVLGNCFLVEFEVGLNITPVIERDERNPRILERFIVNELQERATKLTFRDDDTADSWNEITTTGPMVIILEQ